jgi:hypothetical protein
MVEGSHWGMHDFVLSSWNLHCNHAGSSWALHDHLQEIIFPRPATMFARARLHSRFRVRAYSQQASRQVSCSHGGLHGAERALLAAEDDR